MGSDGRRESPLTARRLRTVGAGLAFLVAVVHLFHPDHGFLRFVRILTIDVGLFLTDPRPVAFTLSGLAIVAGVNLVVLDYPRRPLYALGAGLMGVYVVGYLGWHTSGHGGFLPNREPLYHGLAPHEALIGHLTADPWAATALAAEVLLIAVLGLLLSRDPGTGSTEPAPARGE